MQWEGGPILKNTVMSESAAWLGGGRRSQGRGLAAYITVAKVRNIIVKPFSI